MGIPLAGVFLPALKAVGSAKLPLLLRTAGVVGGAAPSLMRGDLKGAIVGGGIGGLSTLGMGGLATGLAGQAGKLGAQAAARGVGLAGTGAIRGGSLAGNLAKQAAAANIGQKVGATAAPILGGLALGRLAGGGLGGGATNVAKGAAGLAGYSTIGNEGLGGVPLPPGMGPYGNIGPSGLPLDVISPLGLHAGRRLRTVKDAEALRDAQNIVLPTVRKFAEQAKKDDFARSIASRGIAQNIATNAALTQGMAAATRQLGTTAAQQAGAALTQQYAY